MRRMQRWVIALTGIAALTVVSAALVAQDRLKTMPGYEQYQRMAREIPTAVKSGCGFFARPVTLNGNRNTPATRAARRR